MRIIDIASLGRQAGLHYITKYWPDLLQLKTPPLALTPTLFEISHFPVTFRGSNYVNPGSPENTKTSKLPEVISVV